MTKPTYFEGQTCPKCGRHLILKETQMGEFLACPAFPMCKFTKPLPDEDMKVYQSPSPYCKSCNHTGLIPFKKNSKIVPFAWIDCECKLEHTETERYVPVKEGYIDFPCSSTFREFYDETLYGIIPEKGKMIPETVTIVSPEVTPQSSELTHIRTLLIETRDAQQAHFKHHSGIDKKKVQRTPII